MAIDLTTPSTPRVDPGGGVDGAVPEGPVTGNGRSLGHVADDDGASVAEVTPAGRMVAKPEGKKARKAAEAKGKKARKAAKAEAEESHGRAEGPTDQGTVVEEAVGEWPEATPEGKKARKAAKAERKKARKAAKAEEKKARKAAKAEAKEARKAAAARKSEKATKAKGKKAAKAAEAEAEEARKAAAARKSEKATKAKGKKAGNGHGRDGRKTGHDGHDGHDGHNGPATTTDEAKGRKARVGTGASAADRLAALDPDELREDLRLACISRAIDDREISLQKQSRVFFQISGAGHEALYLGFARELRAGYDWFFPYYRDLALVLGLGVSPTDVLRQAVGSADDPASGGRQMPAHWGDPARNIVTQSSPTGSQCIPAVGCAEAGRYIVRRPGLGLPAHGDEITYVSLGEGATSEGEFWESLNTACTEHLPVLYIVADNGYAISVPASEQSPAPINELVQGFAGLQVWSIDGTDYATVRETAKKVVSHVRAGVGPALVHARVTRPYSHSAADTQSKYRLAQEMEWEASHDPIDALERTMIEAGVVSEEEAAAIRAEARETVAAAAKEALAGARPRVDSVLDNVVALPDIPDPGEVATGPEGDDVVALGEAIRRALHESMAADERIRVFGEDVADAREAILADVEGKGGVFGTTHGLQRDFGRARCYNTPLAEANIIGRAVGQAVRGLRPAPEIQFFDYIWPAMQQIRSEAATIRWRSNGAFTCPTVMRVPIGGYLQGGSIWHSQSGESIFAHIPGLLVAFPSRASDAAGLLRAAFRCEDPVLFLEHKHLLRQPYTRDPYPGDDYVVPFGRGRYVTRGADLTIVTWGATVERSRLAAAQLAETDGASIEVVDLRTLVPWDQEMVAESVAKTSRLLVVHEDVVRGGFGGEIAAWAAEQSFWQLDAPIGRVGAQECHVAYAPELETAILPQVDDIATAAHRLLCA
ncbi:MAG TPA: thiamine pyrophosphate-dependent enzyme [Acidimicrobiales bacterium]|nr:thiamine pyrophosphate-dependent enzyme [Acidimicrobiales bacterium]